MKILYSSKFVRSYKKLPNKIKDLAKKKEKIFRKNPFDSRLKTHKLLGKFKGKLKNYWSFSIGYKYRIIFRFAEKDIIYFYKVGTHRIYQ